MQKVFGIPDLQGPEHRLRKLLSYQDRHFLQSSHGVCWKRKHASEGIAKGLDGQAKHHGKQWTGAAFPQSRVMAKSRNTPCPRISGWLWMSGWSISNGNINGYYAILLRCYAPSLYTGDVRARSLVFFVHEVSRSKVLHLGFMWIIRSWILDIMT